jgi:hypothetical protein
MKYLRYSSIETISRTAIVGQLDPLHYRTFISTGANPGVDCVLACEFVTAAYLMTKVPRNPV